MTTVFQDVRRILQESLPIYILYAVYGVLPRFRALLLLFPVWYALWGPSPRKITTPYHPPVVKRIGQWVLLACVLDQGFVGRDGYLYMNRLADALTLLYVTESAFIRKLLGPLPLDTIARGSISWEKLPPATRISSTPAVGERWRIHWQWVSSYSIEIIARVGLTFLKNRPVLTGFWWLLGVLYIPRFLYVSFVLMLSLILGAYIARVRTLHEEAVPTASLDGGSGGWIDVLSAYARILFSEPLVRPIVSPSDPVERPATPPTLPFPLSPSGEETVRFLDDILSSTLNDMFLKSKTV